MGKDDVGSSGYPKGQCQIIYCEAESDGNHDPTILHIPDDELWAVAMNNIAYSYRPCDRVVVNCFGVGQKAIKLIWFSNRDEWLEHTDLEIRDGKLMPPPTFVRFISDLYPRRESKP